MDVSGQFHDRHIILKEGFPDIQSIGDQVGPTACHGAEAMIEGPRPCR
jgi:hypothetical protein